MNLPYWIWSKIVNTILFIKKIGKNGFNFDGWIARFYNQDEIICIYALVINGQ